MYRSTAKLGLLLNKHRTTFLLKYYVGRSKSMYRPGLLSSFFYAREQFPKHTGYMQAALRIASFFTFVFLAVPRLQAFSSMMSSRFPSLLLVVIISCFRRGSAWDECTGGDRSSVLVVPSSGPTVCLPYDDYIQLRQAGAGANSDGETVTVTWPSRGP